MYGYSPNQIARMNPFQQLFLLDDSDSQKTQFFSTEKEYRDFMRRQSTISQ